MDMNAKQAAIRAGYSAHTAKVQGSKLLTHPNVVALVKKLRDEQRDKTVIDRQWILDKFQEIAESPKESGQTRATALDKMAKIVGAYERDNEQKGITAVKITKRIVTKEST